MKKLYFSATVLFLALTSCSSDNNDSNTNGNPTTFLPLTASSSWVYDVNLDAANAGRDSLFVSGETTLNGKTYQQLQTKSIPTGFYTNILNNNNVRINGDKLLLSGTTGLAAGDFLPIEINVSDFVFFKENGNTNEQLDLKTGIIEQDLQGFPLKIDYKLKSVFKESLTNFTVPGKDTYTNVKVMTLTANLKVTTVYVIAGFPATVNILDSQDVIVSTQYYAEGVGMIYSKTNINFEVSDLLAQAGIELPLPEQSSSTIEEFLD